MVREKIRDELPTLLKLYRADKFLVNKIVASATAFFDEVRSDPSHPFRGEFDRMVLSFVDRLGSDPSYAERIDGLKRDLLARPELAEFARNIWSNARSFVERSASGETPGAAAASNGNVHEGGRGACSRSELRAEINHGLVAVLRSFIADQKSGVSSFISDQVKAWDMGQLISLIEINIGSDLQYIRFNGSLIGGLAGLALYTAEYLLRLVVTFTPLDRLRPMRLLPDRVSRLIMTNQLPSCWYWCTAEQWWRSSPSYHSLGPHGPGGNTMSATAQTLRAPSRTLMFLEGRALHELGAFLGALPLLSLAPKGDGHPVLVLPGLVASDSSTRPLRGFLKIAAIRLVVGGRAAILVCAPAFSTR